MTATASGSSSVVAVLKPVNPSIATTSRPLRQASGRAASQVLNACLERPSTMSSSREGPVRSRIGVRSMITVTYLSPRRVWRQTCSSTPMTCDAVEAGRVVDEDPPALGQDGVVGGVPRHRQRLGDPRDREVLDDQPSSAQRNARRDSFARGSAAAAGVLAPHVPAAGAPVAADRDQQRRRSPAQRLVRQPAGHAVARRAFAAAAPAPLVRARRPGRRAPPVRFETLPDDLEAELVEAAERGQVRAREGSVRHVEVFRMGGVRTSILGRPRPLPGHRRAARYTLSF